MELLNLDPIKHLLPQVKGENRPLGLFISTFTWRDLTVRDHLSCQCPLGLVPHFYEDAIDELADTIEECQCPLGLIPHFYGTPSET